MKNFGYVRLESPKAAAQLVADTDGAAFIAGGTTLLDLMKLYVVEPSTLVDIKRMPLGDITVSDSGTVGIGAMVTNTQLAVHPHIRQNFPVLSQAILKGATQQIRNMATVGGNLMQRPFCPYFRDTHYACNKRELGSGCPSIDGHNRGQAVLGTSSACIATHPSDMAVALAALDARVLLRRADGTMRTLAITDFYRMPGDDPRRETVIEDGELIAGVQLPALPAARRSSYRKVRDRSSYQHAVTSTAVVLGLRADGRIETARIAMGGVGTVPWRSREAEAALVGRPATDEVFAAAGRAATIGAKGYSENAFKIALIEKTVARTLRDTREMTA